MMWCDDVIASVQTFTFTFNAIAYQGHDTKYVTILLTNLHKF